MRVIRHFKPVIQCHRTVEILDNLVINEGNKQNTWSEKKGTW